MSTFQPFVDSPARPDGRLELRDYFAIFRKRWPMIVIVASIIFIVAVFITFTTTPIYSSSSQVLLERNLGKSGIESTYYYYEPDFLETQAEIIRSENVAKKVVEKLDLAKKYRSYFLTDSTNKKGLFTIVFKSLRGMVGSLRSLLAADAGKGGSIGRPAIDNGPPLTDEEIIAQIIQAGLSVMPVKNTKIVAISFQHHDPAIARIVVDAVVKAYMDEMLDIKVSTSSYSLKWMTEKAGEERDKLEKSERELQQFVRDNDLVTVENRLTILPQKLADFGSQLSKAEAETKELQDLRTQITSIKNNPDELEKIPLFASDEVLKGLRESIYKAKQNVLELSQKYGKKHPTMIKAMDELKILQDEKKFEIQRIVSTLENSYALAASKQKSLQGLLAETKSETLDLNEKFVQYEIMKREVDSNRVLYDTLQTSIKQQGVTEQSQSVNIWVIKKAETSTIPTSPRVKFNLFVGLVLGVIGGVLVAFLVEHLDNTITTVTQVEHNHGLTVLGSIAYLKGKGNEMETFVSRNPLSPVAESYRLVRSALLLSAAERPPRVILISSMNKSEGKTVTTTNLARMLVQDQKRVLLLDCDLRRPRMHTLLKANNDCGLSGYLAGTVDECPVFRLEDEGLDLIPAGQIPPNPAELLGSERMGRLIEKVSQQYDFVLIDSPPIGVVTDSLTLLRFVDGTVLVVKAGATTHDLFGSGVKKIQDIGAHIIGVVLNGVKVREHNAYQYGYTTYYAKDDD